MGWVDPGAGTKKAKSAAAAADRQVWENEIMLPYSALLCTRELTPPMSEFTNAKAGPLITVPSPACGGGLGWGLTELAAIAEVRQDFRDGWVEV